MGTRGRKSAAELSVANITHIEPRPQAPSDLTDEQATEWDAVVARMPAEHFTRETHAVLAQFCRHVVAAKHVAQLIARSEMDGNIDLEEYDKLLKMQEREGRAMSSLATRMRLTQQTRASRDKKIDAPRKKLWERQ